MTELEELTNDKNLEQLEQELQYQIRQGESMGGEICGHILSMIDWAAFELNESIAVLNQKEKEIVRNGNDLDAYFTKVKKEIQPKYIELYRQDLKFKYISKKSILILLRLNLRHRFVPLHTFGLMCEI